MAPARPLKRQRTNPTEVPPSPQAQAAQIPLPPETPSAVSVALSSEAGTPKQEPRSSFFSRTWPRKAAPLTDIARESASSVANATQEVASVVKDKVKPQRSPSIAMTLGKTSSNQSNRALPVNATTTMVNATPDGPKQNGQKKTSTDDTVKAMGQITIDKPSSDAATVPETQPHLKLQNASTDPPILEGKSAPAQMDDSQTGWLTWLSKRDQNANKSADGQSSGQQHPESVSKPPPNESIKTPAHVPPQMSEAVEHPSPKPEIQVQTNKRNWYQMWNSDNPSDPPKPDASITRSDENDTADKKPPKTQTQNLNIPSTPKSKTTSQASSLETSPPPPLPGDSTKSSGWVFWSRDRNRPVTAKSESEPHLGEIAISDTPSQMRPKRASISLQDNETKPDLQPLLKESQATKAKNQKPEKSSNATAKLPPGPKPPAAKEVPGSQASKKIQSETTTTKAESSNATAKSREPVEVSTPRTASPTPSKKETPNLLLPQFRDTLSLQENPSILQQLARLLYYTKEPEFKHLHIIKDPPRISNALAIGVHGYFPAPLIRSVLGQPTGTSIKFADMAASAIKRWTKSRGYECEVKSAALEGEGRISERVELLWKLLLNWIDEIRKSDFVMIACHSQGVPVAIMLVAKLIAFGCISGARVGICAMAGVNIGPFPEYKSRWISGSAGELFEFSDSNSKVSTAYMAATEEILKHGVRLTYIGSIDDQLVSMESSIFAPITHPHIYRAVFIDGRIHAPNFLSHLVGFALKLRNVGVPDHGLIRELSPPLAGSLYTGEGHSRIYEDESVYDLAISFALETNSLKDIAVSKRPTANNAANPYILPFAMRGILEEDYVKTELQNEARQLLAQFDDWKPTTKALKDVKFRLEGIRSKL